VSALSAIVQIGEPLPLGGGLQPRVIAHWYEGGLSRILAYELGEDGTMSRVPGAYAPALEAEVAYPVTDILLAIARDNSARYVGHQGHREPRGLLPGEGVRVAGRVGV